MPVKDVHITITRETMPISQAGFGKPLIVAIGDDKDYTVCTDTAAVEDAGFDTTSTVYEMAEKVFAQSPSPQEIAVAGVEKEDENATATVEAKSGAKVKVYAVDDNSGETGNDKSIEFKDSESGELSASEETDTLEVDFGGDESATAQEIVAAINEVDNYEAEVVEVGDFTAEDDTDIGEDFSGGKDSTIAGGLNDLVDKNDDFYFLLADTQDKDDIEALASWAAANEKLYFVQPDEEDVQATLDNISLNYSRAVVVYHDDSDERLDAAWVGKCAPQDPGSITWKFKTLEGASAADVGTTEINNLHNANMNTYIEKLGVKQTSEGLTTSGEFIDVIRGQDWVKARISERVHMLLFNAPKVPFTNAGISQVLSKVESVMKDAVARGLIATDANGNGIFEVDAPARADVPETKRANRILPDVEFSFELAGAIHEVKINGVIQV